jgi:hypothetical protein
MQITSSAIKRLAFIICAFSYSSLYAQTLDESHLAAYRAEYKDTATPVKYVFVHADGSPCCSTGANTNAYLLNITRQGPAKLAHSTEIDRLFKENFEVEIDNESVIPGPKGDFLVLTMSRPAENNPKYVPCAGGMGESRAYLVSVVANKITVVSRDFGGCGREYKVLGTGPDVGYEVTGSGPHAKSVRYVIQGNNIVRQSENR